MKNVIIVLFTILMVPSIHGQEFHHVLGLRISLTIATPQKATGASIAMTYGIYRTPQVNASFNWLPAYQLSVNAYLNGIGTDYRLNEIQLDIHQSLAISAYSNQLKLWSLDIQPEFHFLDASYLRNLPVIPLESSSSLLISSNFILNLAGRHQLYGSLLGQLGKFRIQHYNDGGIIMGKLKIGDGKDRWWTGGTFLEFGHDLPLDSVAGFQSRPQKIRLSFDRFTWDNQAAFEAATEQGLEWIPIIPDRQQDAQYNFGQYALTVYWDRFSIGVAANNQLKDLQDILHQIGHLAKHPTLAPAYYSLRVAGERRF